ncbi:MAG: thiamine pyrophosphate-binding protein [Chloroflexi bacterium]|nr:thiamine pyrophosphate-binding protein [Chloroflexota bacterium]
MTTPSSGMVSGSELIGRALALEGVKNVFTIAGDHVLPALDTMADMGFRFVDTRHEQAAAHMADAWGRITGEPGVAMYTTPGFSNAIPGLANAQHSESPLLSISGSAELAELGRGAMQEIDQVGMARPVCKSAWMVTDTRRIPDMIAHALRVAYSGRRGPVHLTIPVDIQQNIVSEDEVALYAPNEYRGIGAAQASQADIEQAIAILHAAERPLIVAGSAAAYSRSGEAMQAFIETTRIPLLTEGDARGLVSDEHPYCLGFFDQGLSQASRKIRDADAVLMLGRKQDLIIGYAMAPTISADAAIIQIDPSEAEIGRNRGVAVGIAGDVEATLRQLTAEAGKRVWSDLPWLNELRAERRAWQEHLESLAVPDAPMHAMFVHRTVMQQLSPDDYLIFDGGDYCHFARAYLPARFPKSWLYVTPSGMLGHTIPTALAAKLAHPDRRVIAFSGDGAFGFNGMEYDTAVRHNLPFVCVMGNDSAWGIDRQIQLGVYGKPVATDLLPTRYDQVVRGLGGHGEIVENPEELHPALERCLKLERPALINVQVQRQVSPRGQSAINRWKSHTIVPI